jgi:hypothetical protein
MRTSTWRTVALSEAQRLENELAFVRPDSESAVAVVPGPGGHPTSPSHRRHTPLHRWWSGALVEDAWSNLELAAESLVLV